MPRDEETVYRVRPGQEIGRPDLEHPRAPLTPPAARPPAAPAVAPEPARVVTAPDLKQIGRGAIVAILAAVLGVGVLLWLLKKL